MVPTNSNACPTAATASAPAAKAKAASHEGHRATPPSSLIKVVTALESSRTGQAAWPEYVRRMQNVGTADQSIYLRGKSVRDSLRSFHAGNKGSMNEASTYDSVESRRLYRPAAAHHHHATDRSRPQQQQQQQQRKRRYLLHRLCPQVFARHRASSPGSAGIRVAASASSEPAPTIRAAAPAMAPNLSNDPLLSRLFRAPIRKRPRKSKKTSSGATARPKPVTARHSSSTPSTAAAAAAAAAISAAPTDHSTLDRPLLPDDGTSREEQPERMRTSRSRLPWSWPRRRKGGRSKRSRVQGEDPAATVHDDEDGPRKPPRQQLSNSSLYLLVCVGLCCMPCLCVNYACHRDEEL
ncbi:hypothetical protein SYNPS1DRAFT_30971 [Syncephalis pseudoplumigaleata]|uniref:Uncharacterized protein n=1 Tax=Syncephalis pseudoplumigaleata TaxID=1712513 RepID=A0A4P9YV65_9FUNG|nr:hypothetical protein SYNPS1DRAFT_30971 [Syncephalis pseudoplumigaleata]|eukprot:RKP23302.1 hypothetical protein SYNPS1DRAFT_30971 [Syncephalis pseudoplumigaleata]